MSSTGQPSEVIVLGAGVIGLQTALSLIEAGFQVTLVSKYWPGDESIDYTSPWAGAHWRPHCNPEEPHVEKYEKETFNYWLELVKKEHDAGIFIVDDAYLFDDFTPETITSLWWRDFVPGFALVPESELPPGVKGIVKYKSFCIDIPVYLGYLLGKLGDGGVKTITAEVDSLEETFTLPGIDTDKVIGVVNCTGMGARTLVPDETVYPTKGQTVVVKGLAKQVKFREGKDYIAYALPRPSENATILGGNKAVLDWDPDPNPVFTAQVLENCKILCPEILNENGEFDFIRAQVGRRPSRKGGPRVGVQAAKCDSTKFICHNYGHGGAGYQCSVGSAQDVVRIIKHFTTMRVRY